MWGVLVILFGLANLAMVWWVVARQRASRPLPRMMRSWEVVGRTPLMAVVLACLEIVVGALMVIRAV